MPFDGPHERPFSDIDRLLAARGKIASPNQWTKGALTRDDNRYCVVGALMNVCGSLGESRLTTAGLRLARLLADQLPKRNIILGALLRRSPVRRLMKFNDNRWTRHSDALALFDRAIKRLQVTTTITARR
jgi:hypothetical protein